MIFSFAGWKKQTKGRRSKSKHERACWFDSQQLPSFSYYTHFLLLVPQSSNNNKKSKTIAMNIWSIIFICRVRVRTACCSDFSLSNVIPIHCNILPLPRLDSAKRKTFHSCSDEHLVTLGDTRRISVIGSILMDVTQVSGPGSFPPYLSGQAKS